MTACRTLLCLLLSAVPAAAQTSPPPLPADRERTLALAADRLNAGRVEDAERLLRSAGDRFQSVEALLQLARLQSRRGDAPGALESLRKARTIAPNSEDVLSALAQVSLAAHAPLPAIASVEALTRLCPSVAQYHYLLGVALMQIGDMSMAVDALEAAERLEPDHTLTLVALGLALNNRKLYAEARPFLLRSLDLNPDSTEAIAALAESEEGLGDLQSAEAHARRALARPGATSGANLVLGLLFMKKQQYEQARDAFTKVVEADPDSSKAHYQLSLACARLGDDACAQKHVDLYKQKLREIDERVRQLRMQTGLAATESRP